MHCTIYLLIVQSTFKIMTADKTKLTFTIDPRLKEELKILGIRRGVTMGELIVEALQSKWFPDTVNCIEKPKLS